MPSNKLGLRLVKKGSNKIKELLNKMLILRVIKKVAFVMEILKHRAKSYWKKKNLLKQEKKVKVSNLWRKATNNVFPHKKLLSAKNIKPS